MVRDVVHDRDVGDAGVVELEISDMRRIRTPPVASKVAPAVDLLLVDPVELAVSNDLVAIGRQCVLSTVVHVDDVEISVSNERHHQTVRAEGDFFFALGGAREPRHPGNSESIVVEVVGYVEGHRCPGWVDHVCWVPGQATGLRAGDSREVSERRLHLHGVEEWLSVPR